MYHTSNFHIMIRHWSKIEELNGPDALKHPNSNKVWTPEMKYELVAKVLAGQSNKSVAFSAGINDGMLYSWVRKYKEFSYNGLVNKKKGRKSDKSDMSKKYVEPKPLAESEREELIRLRAENEVMRTEIEKEQCYWTSPSLYPAFACGHGLHPHKYVIP